MMTKAKAKADDPQSKRFMEKARELGCDEDEAAFETRLKKIANATPNKQPQKPTKKAR